jgi:N utilization substance protein A
LGEGLVEKLKAAGVNTVESLADMTPEQLEAIEGIGPKTVEKISIAVNNYFATLDGGEAVAAAEPEGTEEAATEAAFSVESATEGSVEAEALAPETSAEAEPTEMAAAEEVAEPSTEEGATEEPTAEAATEEAAEDKKS